VDLTVHTTLGFQGSNGIVPHSGEVVTSTAYLFFQSTFLSTLLCSFSPAVSICIGKIPNTENSLRIDITESLPKLLVRGYVLWGRPIQRSQTFLIARDSGTLHAGQLAKIGKTSHKNCRNFTCMDTYSVAVRFAHATRYATDCVRRCF